MPASNGLDTAPNGQTDPVLAQAASIETGDVSATLRGLHGSSGADLGRRVADAIYADDPAADTRIVDWYAESPLVAPSASSPDTPLVLPLDVATALFNAFGNTDSADPGEPARLHGGSGLELGRAGGRASRCTLEAVAAAEAPLAAFVEAHYPQSLSMFLDPLAEALEGGWRPPDRLLPGISPIGYPDGEILFWARTFDALYKTNYWTARFVQASVQASVENLLRLNYHIYDAPSNNALAAKHAALGNDWSDAERVRSFYADVAALRHQHLHHIADYIDHLRRLGCAALAETVHVSAAIAFAIGEERATLDAIPVAYWNAFNLPRPITGQSTYQWPSVLDAASFDKELSSDALLGGFRTDRVDSILGPLPPMPEFDAEGRPASSSPADDSESSARLPPDRTTADGSGRQENGSADGIDDRPDGTTTALARAAPPGNLSLAGRTWLSAGGIGDWPQTTLAGFWRSSDIEGSEYTLVATNPDGSHFDGIVVDESGPSGPWLSMDRDGTTNGWRGTASVALRNPAGACPHWVPAVFAIRPGAMTINGAWSGKKVDPDDCKETNEPDNGLLRLERVVATTFKPLIPGKFIHLIGVPAGGSTNAQFKAAVAFSCADSTLPLGTPKVTVSGGDVVETDECAYQLVVDRSGGYDITIEFSDASGKVIHADHLHADVPPIPGLGG